MGPVQGDHPHDLSGGSGELDPIEVSGDPWRGFLTHLKPDVCVSTLLITAPARSGRRTRPEPLAKKLKSLTAAHAGPAPSCLRKHSGRTHTSAPPNASGEKTNGGQSQVAPGRFDWKGATHPLIAGLVLFEPCLFVCAAGSHR